VCTKTFLDSSFSLVFGEVIHYNSIHFCINWGEIDCLLWKHGTSLSIYSSLSCICGGRHWLARRHWLAHPPSQDILSSIHRSVINRQSCEWSGNCKVVSVCDVISGQQQASFRLQTLYVRGEVVLRAHTFVCVRVSGNSYPNHYTLINVLHVLNRLDRNVRWQVIAGMGKRAVKHKILITEPDRNRPKMFMNIVYCHLIV
jgi:hypothetical protein